MRPIRVPISIRRLLSLLNSSDPTKYDPDTGVPDPVNGLTKKQQGQSIVNVMRPFYPTTIGNITEIQSVGKSLTHTVSFQYRVNNYPLFHNKVRLTGNLTYTVTRGKDDSQFENPYNRDGGLCEEQQYRDRGLTGSSI